MYHSLRVLINKSINVIGNSRYVTLAVQYSLLICVSHETSQSTVVSFTNNFSIGTRSHARRHNPFLLGE